MANQADAEEVNRLAPIASKKTNEEEDNQASAEVAAFRALRTKVESGGFYLRQEEPSYETKERVEVHQQITYETRQVTAEPKAQENCQLQQRRVKSEVAPFSRKGKRYRRTLCMKERDHLKHRGRRRRKEAKEERRFLLARRR